MKRIVGLLLCAVLLFSLCGCNSQDYEKALDLMRSEDFASAKVIFDKLGDYKDSAQKSQSCTYSMAMLAYNDGRYEEAKAGFFQIEDYKDAGTMCVKCDYNIAKYMLQKGKYEEAYALFTSLGEYESSVDYAVEAKWGMLYQYIEENGTYHEDLEHKVLSMSIEDDNENTQEHIVYVYAESPDNITIGYRDYVGDSSWLILQTFSINLEKGQNEADWVASGGLGFWGVYSIEAGSGSVRIDTCTKNTSLKIKLYSIERKDADGNKSTSTDKPDSNLIEPTIKTGLEKVLTYVPKILKSTGLPIEMKDLGFLAVR